MNFKAVSSILCLQVVIGYASEPYCPDATFGREILKQTLETRTIVKILQQEIAGIRNGLYENAVLFNDRMEFNNIKQNLTVLFGKLERVEGKLDSLETKLTKVSIALEPQPAKRESDASPLSILPDALEKPAFSVVLLQHRIHQTGYDDVIKFDSEISNIGGHYSKVTGQFTAPMDGVYMFSASILADHNEEIWGYIRAGDKVVRINERGTDDRHGQGSNTMVVALKSGDHVTVHGGSKIYGDSYTAFSGFLIQ